MLGILVAINYIGARQNKRWDLTANKQFSLSDQSRNVLAKLDAPLQIMVFAQEPEFQRFPRPAEGIRVRVEAGHRPSTSIPTRSRRVAQQNQVQQYGTIVFNYKGRTERVTSDTEQDITNGIIKVVSGQQRKVYFTQGHGEKDTTSQRARRLQRDRRRRSAARTTPSTSWCSRSRARCPTTRRWSIVAGPRDRLLPAGNRGAQEVSRARPASCCSSSTRRTRPTARRSTNLIALAHDWGIDVGNDVVVDASGMGRLIGTDASVPVAANYPSHPITERFNVLTAYPLARSVTPVTGGVNGHTAQPFVEIEPAELGRSRHQERC